MRVWLIVAGMLGFTGAGYAASFDCKVAKTPFEKAICGDEDLSRQDERLAATYKGATDGLSDGAKAVMKNNQREWLGFLGKVCADGMIKHNVSDMPDYKVTLQQARVNCLADLYRDRVAELEGYNELNKKQMDSKFYAVDKYVAVADTATGDESYPVAKHSVSYPQIDGTSEEDLAFNAFVKARIENLIKSPDYFDATSDTGDGLTVQYVTDALINMDAGGWFYGHGAAHPMSSSAYVSYLWKEKRELMAGDIFRGAAWKTELPKMVEKALVAEIGELGYGDAESNKDAIETVKAGSIDPKNWSFDKTGLGVNFGSYAIAPYAAGSPSGVVPWDKLRGYFGPSATVILGI